MSLGKRFSDLEDSGSVFVQKDRLEQMLSCLAAC